MKRKEKCRIAWGAMTLLAIAVVAGCSGNKAAKTADGSYPGAEGSSANPELFSVPKEQLAHVQVVTIEPTTWARVLRLPGAVAFNAFATTPVITQIGGPVSRIVVVPGQYVHKGQPMLYVSSPDYAQARANYLKARDAYDLAQKTLARSRDLYAHHGLAEKDLQAAESAEVQAKADLQAATQALEVLGIRQPDTVVAQATSPELPVRAPIDGEAVERLCGPGQVIQAGQTQCFTISNLKTVWVLVNVYQDQLANVHVGDPVTISTESYPEKFQGRIQYVGAALDPNSRTLQARIDTKNPQRKLKKDMYVTATVMAGQIKDAIAVPDAAVLRDSENEPFVYVLVGQDQFARRGVKIGESQNGETRIMSGLQVGEKVAGDGSLFLQFANSLQR